MKENDKRCHQKIFQNVCTEFVDGWVRKQYGLCFKNHQPCKSGEKNTCSPPVVHARLKRWKFIYWYKWWRHRHGGASLYVDRLWPRGRWGHSNLLNTEGRQLKKEVIKYSKMSFVSNSPFLYPWKNQLFYWTCIVKSIKGYF